MKFQHAVVWIDHTAARILHFEDQSFPVRSFRKSIRLQAPEPAGPELAEKFMGAVCDALGDTPQVLLTGTPEALAAFERHLASKAPQVARRVIGVQAVAAPTNRRLSALARWHFTQVVTPAAPAGDT